MACVALVVISHFCAVRAAAFTSSADLKTAVDNCLAAVPSGENCCSAGGADCGAACATDMPDWDVSLVTSMEELFSDKYDFNQDISRWETSNVKSMRQMFSQAQSFTASDLADWNVGKVKDMNGMFQYGWDDNTFSNLDLSRWNVGEVTDMGNMFYGARGFNSDISGWDVSKVTAMYSMFYGAHNFTGDLSRWNVGEVTDMSYMFSEAASFDSDISGWDVSKVTGMDSMFERAVAFSQDITGWSFDDSGYADQYYDSGHTYVYTDRMFSGATAFFGSYTNCGYDDSDADVCTGTYETSDGMYDGPPGAWEVGASIGCINSVPSPFKTSAALRHAVELCLAAVPSGENCCSAGGADCGAACATDMPDWDVSLVTSMEELFSDKYDFNQDISRWETSNVKSMRQMFSQAQSFTASDLADWNVGKVKDMNGMFQYGWDDNTFSNLDLSRWNVGEVTDMGNMFYGARGFNSDISGWDVSKVTAMYSMFYGAHNFTGDLSRWNVGEVTDMSYMFSEAASFDSDISGWDVSKVTGMDSMFERAVAFSQDITGWSFDDSGYADQYYDSGHTYVYTDRMFSGATAFFGSYTNCGYDDSDADVCTGTYETSDGMYDGPPGAWQRNTCDASTAPRNGNVGDCTAFLEPGETCQPTCDPGYAVTGPSACEAGALASGFCLDTSGPACDASAAPRNGDVGDCTATLVSGTICQPTCDPGTELSGVGFSYCDGGAFTAATCEAEPCASVPAPSNGARGDCGAALEHGATCQPVCDDGFIASGATSCVLGTLDLTVCVVAYPSPPPPSLSPPPSPPSPPPNRLVALDYDSGARRVGASRAARSLALFAACAAAALA